MNDYPIPSSRRRGREWILAIICLIPHGVHSRLQLGTGLSGLIGSTPLPDAGVNVIDIISLSRGQFPILPQEHHSGHWRIIVKVPGEVKLHGFPLPVVCRIMSITLTQLENNALSLTREIRGRSPSKMKNAESPKFVAFILTFRPHIYHAHSKRMPLQRMSRKIIEHRPNINVPLFRLYKSTC